MHLDALQSLCLLPNRLARRSLQTSGDAEEETRQDRRSGDVKMEERHACGLAGMASPVFNRGPSSPKTGAVSRETGLSDARRTPSVSPASSSRPCSTLLSGASNRHPTPSSAFSVSSPSSSVSSPPVCLRSQASSASLRPSEEGEVVDAPCGRRQSALSHAFSGKKSSQKSSGSFSQPRTLHLRLSDWSRRDRGPLRREGGDILLAESSADTLEPQPRLHLACDFPSVCSLTSPHTECRDLHVASRPVVVGEDALRDQRSLEEERREEAGSRGDAEAFGATPRNETTPAASVLSSAGAGTPCTSFVDADPRFCRRFPRAYLRLTSETSVADGEESGGFAGVSERARTDRAGGGDPGGVRRLLKRMHRLRQRPPCRERERQRGDSRDGFKHKASASAWFSGDAFRRELRKKCFQCSRTWRKLSRDPYSGAHARSVNIVDLYAAYDEVHEAPHNENLHSQLFSRVLSPSKRTGEKNDKASSAQRQKETARDTPIFASSNSQERVSTAPPTTLRRCLYTSHGFCGRERISLWIALVLIGILTALVSYFLDWGVDFVLLPLQENAVQRHSYTAIFAYSVACAVVATACCLLVPQSQGSGIPELRTVLSGSFLPDFCAWPTFFARCVGLLACICGGLSVGKEGPVVHLSAILATQLCRLRPLQALTASPSKLLSILDVAVAAGVTATFGTPFGGVLFSIEVTATFFLVHALWKSYFCCIFCVLTFRLLHERLSPIEQLYQGTQLPSFDVSWEVLSFAILGAVCGCLGGLFVWAASKVFQLSRKHVYPSAGRKILFVSAVMLALNVLSHHSVVLKSEDRLKLGEFFDVESLDTNKWSSHVFLSLFLFVIFKFAATILSVACPVPAGIFTPIFVCGAALGRLYGKILRHFVPTLSSPAAYALVGAASLAAGTTRTISVSMIVFELTGKLSHMIPVLLAVLIAYGVNGFFTISIYDVMLLIKDLPYVPKLKSMHAYNLQAKDIMAATAYSRRGVGTATAEGEGRGDSRDSRDVRLCTDGLSRRRVQNEDLPLTVEIELPWLRSEQARTSEKRYESTGKHDSSSRPSSPVPLLLKEKDAGNAVLMQSEEETTESSGDSPAGGSLSGVCRWSSSAVRTHEMGTELRGDHCGSDSMPGRGEGESSGDEIEETPDHDVGCFDETPSPEDEEDAFIVAIDKERSTVLDLVFCRLLYAGVAIPVVSSVAHPRVEGAVPLSALDRYLASLDIISVSPSAPTPAIFSPFSPRPLSRPPAFRDSRFPRRKRLSLQRLGGQVRRLLVRDSGRERRPYGSGERRRLENRGGRSRDPGPTQTQGADKPGKYVLWKATEEEEEVEEEEEEEEEETDAGLPGAEGRTEWRSCAETGRGSSSEEASGARMEIQERRRTEESPRTDADRKRGSRVAAARRHQRRQCHETDESGKEGTVAGQRNETEQRERTAMRRRQFVSDETMAHSERTRLATEEMRAEEEETLATVTRRILARVLALYSPVELLCLDSFPIDWTRLEVDAAPLCVLPGTPVSKVHFMFTMLFLGQVFVSDNAGLLLGVITKQSLMQADDAATSSLSPGTREGCQRQANTVKETFHLFSLLKSEIRRLCRPARLHARHKFPVRIS
ncbi:chloride transporter, chloride channel (ClC) family protein [Toxoplasma gondii GT1]|nr:chloride transporter, chloride channel (ClC) family protein [Toxoplasma gondii GT1]